MKHCRWYVVVFTVVTFRRNILLKENDSLSMWTFFLRNLPIRSENVHVSSKIPKSSPGQVKFSFVNPAKSFFLKVRKRFINLFKKFLQCSCGHVECSFGNPTEIFSPKVRKLFTQSPIKLFCFGKNLK